MNIANIPGIPAEHSMAIVAIFSHFSEVHSLVLYGSRAKGDFRPESDIDLCIKNSCISLQRILLIEGRIDDLLLPYTVDLTRYDSIENPDLRQHIDRTGLLLYQAQPNHRT